MQIGIIEEGRGEGEECTLVRGRRNSDPNQMKCEAENLKLTIQFVRRFRSPTCELVRTPASVE